jgi:hypothetical protein
MTDLRAAAQQALEAMESGLAFDAHSTVLQNLRTALAQEHAMHDLARLGQEIEQEPVAWMVTYGGLTHIEYTLPSKVVDTHYQPLYTTPPAAQPEQEPVAYYHPRNGFYWAKPTSIFAPTVVDVQPMPLYTSPAQREWQSLTDEDWEKVVNRKNTVLDTFEQGATWAAYKLERRNT